LGEIQAMKSSKNSDRKPVMQTVEEATALLRGCTAGTWLWYFLGTCPFVCTVLHFWNDMTHSGDALEQLPRAALVLSLSYIWMKTAQAIFADKLMQLLRGEGKAAPLPFRGKLRLISSQALIHSTMPLVMPVAGMALIPVAWTYAFYHNATTLAASHFRAGGNTRGLMRSALTQAHYMPGANHGCMIIILIFGMLMWLNFWVGIITAAQLMRSFTGVENELTRNPMMMLDTGFLAATIMMAYLMTAPVVRAIYALRCFQGLSLKNGEDLMAQLRMIRGPIKAGAVAAMLFFTSVGTWAQEVPPASETARAEEIDQRIQDVLKEDMFRWRMPKETVSDSEMGPISSFVKEVMKMLTEGAESTFKSIRDFWKKLFPDRDLEGSDSSGEGTPWADSVETIVYFLVILLVLLLIFVAWRQWRLAGPKPMVSASAPPPIDLKDEQVMASQLPENEWLKLAEEKIEAGELRLALRALFLASLAHLGERRMIAISRTKSNGDYVRELSFRAREQNELRECFNDNVRSFDRVWYGWHEVTREVLEHFRGNHNRISAHGTSR
jgi:hypothetical protein